MDETRNESSEQPTVERPEEIRPESKSLFIFGRDVSKIPCFRNSVLYGIYGGIGSGLGYFLFTSRVPAACNVAVYSFCGVTIAYWIHCRYQYSTSKMEMLRMQKLLRERTLYEGTYRDPDFNNDTRPD